MNAEESLRQISLFSQMKQDDLERIVTLTREHVFQIGDVIIREGERDNRLFIIVEGEVEVVKDLGGRSERSLKRFGPNSYFGEMALIDDLLRSASVVARDETRVLSLDRWNLHKEIENYPSLAIELLQVLSKRLRALEKTMIRTLGGFIPICASCKRIRDDDGKWVSIEEYISDRSGVEFTHGICPECSEKLYPGYG